METLDQYKIGMLLVGATYAAPNRQIILYLFANTCTNFFIFSL